MRGTGGGPEKTILMGAARSDPGRFKVTVCYLRDARDTVFGIDARAAALPIDYVEVRERHSLDFRAWGELRRLVRNRRIDIVHAHEYKTDAMAAFLARTEGVAPLATVHGWTGNTWRERLVYYPADRKILAKFPRLIAVSDDISRTLARSGADPSRISTILNGIDPHAFVRDPAQTADRRAALGFGADDLVIGTVGRLEAQKRIDLLLEAVARLRPTYPRIRLVVVGDGSQREPLEHQAARLLPAGMCTFTGHRTDIVALHHTFDVFVQSSDYEGTPNAVLEAMALETPIVATDAGGTSSLVDDGVHGLIVGKGDVRLTLAIRRVLDDRDGARARAAAGRRRVETQLSFDARMRAVERIYDELAEGRSPGTGAV